MTKIDSTIRASGAALFAVLPYSVRRDVNLTDSEKLLYAEVTAVADGDGICRFTNAYIAQLMNKDERSVIRYLNNLESRGYLDRIKVGRNSYLRVPTVMISFVKPAETIADHETLVGPALAQSKKIIDYWKEKRKLTEIYGKDLVQRMVIERLNDFSEDQILEAIDNRVDFLECSEWHNRPENIESANKLELIMKEADILLKWYRTKPPKKKFDLKKDIMKPPKEEGDLSLLN